MEAEDGVITGIVADGLRPVRAAAGGTVGSAISRLGDRSRSYPVLGSGTSGDTVTGYVA